MGQLQVNITHPHMHAHIKDLHEFWYIMNYHDITSTDIGMDILKAVQEHGLTFNGDICNLAHD